MGARARVGAVLLGCLLACKAGEGPGQPGGASSAAGGTEGDHNIVASVPCIPTTCARERRNCGAVADGCGGFLQCGACGAAQTCGGSGQANVCGAPLAPGGGKVLRVITGEGQVQGLASDGSSHLYTLWSGTLAMRGGDLAPQWTREHAEEHLVAGPWRHPATGELFVSGFEIDPETGWPSKSVRLKLDQEGSVPELVDWCSYPCRPDVMAFGAQRTFATLTGFSNGQLLSMHWSDGHRVWSVDASPRAFEGTFPFQLDSLAFDAQGNLVVGGRTLSRFSFQGTPLGQNARTTPVLLKLSPNGQLLWARELPGSDGAIVSLAVTRSGEVIAAGALSGRTSWGDTTLWSASAPEPEMAVGFLLMADSNGTPRWARQLGPLMSVPKLALDPAGRIALAMGPARCGAAVVQERTLDGDLLWSRELAPARCSEWIKMTSIARVNGLVVVGGQLHGTADLGNGAPISGDETGFILSFESSAPRAP